MEVKVDGGLIRSERERRAWSQAHLAKAAGLGLRTVQRIEATGQASHESVKSLAAVLEIPVSSIRIEKAEGGSSPRRRRSFVKPVAALAVSVIAALAVLFAPTVSARNVMLEIGVALNDEQGRHGRLLIADGKDAEIRIGGVMRLVVVPRIQDDGSVFIAARVYEPVGEDFVLLAEPRLLTADKETAEVRIMSSDHGNDLRFTITPTVQQE